MDGEDYPAFVTWALNKYQFSETGGVENANIV